MFYRLLQWAGRFVVFCTQRVHVRGLEHLPPDGGWLLASTHLGHLDPYCISTMIRPRVHWMARAEFFRCRMAALFMRGSGAFPVNRQGVPVRAMRTALHLLDSGRNVGIFPEGEVMSGSVSVLAGGPLKRGVCMLARRSGCAVVPCVIRGAEKLLALDPWLPARRGRFEIAFGPPIFAGGSGSRRERDLAFAGALAEALHRIDQTFPEDLRGG